MVERGSNLIVALDYSSAESAIELAEKLNPEQVRLKVGKQLFTHAGPDVVRKLHDLGFDIFLDLKFHDIPNTVAQAVQAAADLGVWMVNVHALGGSRMMAAATKALSARSHPPLLVAVTVLTSMGREDLDELGWGAEPIDRVCHLASLAQKAGLDGVVCSAAEAAVLSDRQRPGFCLVTPGIRQTGDAVGDQRRVVTPVEAVSAGATHLVMGRSITDAPDPAGTVDDVLESLQGLQGH
ncbi:MAG: orotidine-5'-phosphate decarboxylase [Luminiphilus sp.]|jgi:orotidine-5'-phosphate decarboxylase|nr:orotidine-5'-phosphate decarboxylase [Luminiphilus sp.]